MNKLQTCLEQLRLQHDRLQSLSERVDAPTDPFVQEEDDFADEEDADDPSPLPSVLWSQTSSLAALSSPSLLWQPTVQYQTHCRCLCDLDWVGAC